MKRILPLLVLISFGVMCRADQSKSDVTNRLQQAGNVLRQVMDTPDKGIPEEVMEHAKCVAVVPHLVKGGFVFGAEGGRGVATCRTAHGWSTPAFFDVEGGSWGLQIGVEGIDLVMIIQNDHGMQQLLGSRFQIGADASAAGTDGQALLTELVGSPLPGAGPGGRAARGSPSVDVSRTYGPVGVWADGIDQQPGTARAPDGADRSASTPVFLGRAATGFMPDDEGEALFLAALRAGRRARSGRHLRRDRGLVRQVHHLPRGGRRGDRGGAVQPRPPPRLRGEPGRVGAPRPDAGRPGYRPDRHPPPLAADRDRRRARGLGRRRGRRLAHGAARWRPRWPSASSTAATARSRRGPTTGAGPPTWLAGGWLAIHDVFPDPADGVAPPSTSGGAALESGEFVEDGECGSLRVLRRRHPNRRRPVGSSRATVGRLRGSPGRPQGRLDRSRRCRLGEVEVARQALAPEQPEAGVDRPRASAASTMAPAV